MKELELTKGYITVVDDDDYEWLKTSKWKAQISGKNIYAIHRKGNKHEYLHRVIMKAVGKECVDHMDGNTLNNQKSNLRICTNIQNLHNSKKPKNSTAVFKGVAYIPKTQRWRARICYNYKHIHIGVYATAEEAARAYNKKAIELVGEFAKLNKIS